MELIREFERLGKADAGIAGGKGASLGEMIQAGIPVPPGGVTTHAAIVAREMKKPCVVGTKFATQILKDGDLVEVDANSGIVRVIEKA